VDFPLRIVRCGERIVRPVTRRSSLVEDRASTDEAANDDALDETCHASLAAGDSIACLAV